MVDGNVTITLTDIVGPPTPQDVVRPDRAQTITANLVENSDSVLNVPGANTSPATLPDVIFILHGVMSSKSEQDFELGMLANLDATRALLEAIRKRWLVREQEIAMQNPPRVIFTSCLAVYGPPSAGEKVSETTVPAPQSNYGTAKVMCEALVAEYLRRGWVQGLVLRLPTVSVRPGAPAAAASAFLSGIIHEPLNGKASILPIRDDGLEVWLSSPKTVVQNLVHAATLSVGTLSGQHMQQKSQRPVINLPGVTITVADMLTALERVGGKQASSLVQREPNAGVERSVASWPATFDASLAKSLGFIANADFNSIVRAYKAQYVDGR